MATPVGLVDDLAKVVERFAPGGRGAALLAELRADSTPVEICAPLVVATELIGILEDLDETDEIEDPPGGLLLCAGGRALLACTVGTRLVVGEDVAVVAGPGHLELQRPGSEPERLTVLTGSCWALGQIDAVLPATAAQALRWQLARLVSALSVGGDACLSWSDKPPLA